MELVLAGRRGFTLLEVLIAVSLMALLVTALYASYFTLMAARERAAEGMEARRELGATLDLLRREIDASRFARDEKRLRFVVEDRDIFGAPSSTLELTTPVPPSPDSVPRSGMATVRYRIVEQDKRLVLVRREQDLLSPSDTAPEYPQMERISAFLVECYDGGKWVRSWDTALNGSLPRQVRITVRIEEAGRPVEFTALAVPRVSSL